MPKSTENNFNLPTVYLHEMLNANYEEGESCKPLIVVEYLEFEPIEFYTPSESGHYNVDITLTDAYGESITITDGINIDDCPNTIAETETDSPYSLYPNPATNKLHLEIPNLTQAQEATIYDAQGKLVYTQPIHSKTASLDISSLQPGNYILKINGISKSFTVVR
ncbi:MAG: T9SS type A sorting domain-containing protein [Candidatus Delongbacteria bacterium]|nr:T9SS type A sorting domain-containing protein [Candidatus Delongbacteria bacterium]